MSQVIESPQNDGTGIVTKITPSDELYDGKFINSMIFIKYPDIDYGPLTPFLGKPVKNLIYEIYNETLGFNKHTFEIIKNDQNIINKIYYASNGVILEEVNINSN